MKHGTLRLREGGEIDAKYYYLGTYLPIDEDLGH